VKRPKLCCDVCFDSLKSLPTIYNSLPPWPVGQLESGRKLELATTGTTGHKVYMVIIYYSVVTTNPGRTRLLLKLEQRVVLV